MTIEEAIKELEPYVFTDEELTPTIRRYSEALSMAIQALKTVHEHEETFEWCINCKEYDKENYCCHRWSKVIRNTVKDIEDEFKIVRCSDCIHSPQKHRDCPVICEGAVDIVYCGLGEREEP